MSFPVKYSRLFDYLGYQNANPTRPLPGVRVNADLNDLKRVTDQTIDFLGLSFRSDGSLSPLAVSDIVVNGAANVLAAASASATAAAGSATAASGSSTTAGSNATAAAASATAAAASATAAATSAANARTKLVAATNFYVRTDGNDSNTGLANTSGGAFLTLQGAYDKIYKTYDCNSFIATINVGAGTYTAGLSLLGPPAVGTPSGALNGIQFVGDVTTPSNVIISTAGVCCLSTFQGSFVVSGIKFVSSGNDCLYASGGGRISVAGKVEFGAAAGYHMHANLGGIIVVAAANIRIAGGAQCFLYAEKGSQIEIGAGTIKTTTAVAFSLGTVVVKGSYIVLVQTLVWDVSSGAVTGQRYIATFSGSIETQTGSGTHIPGSIAGNATDGHYN